MEGRGWVFLDGTFTSSTSGIEELMSGSTDLLRVRRDMIPRH
jgi:hypothetical protein